MPRNVAQRTRSWATRMRTEPEISPCGGMNIPKAAKMMAETKLAMERYFFIGVLDAKAPKVAKYTSVVRKRYV